MTNSIFQHSIFQLISLVLGKDIDSLIDEAIQEIELRDLYFSKLKHIEYLKIRKKRKFKHKI